MLPPRRYCFLPFPELKMSTVNWTAAWKGERSYLCVFSPFSNSYTFWLDPFFWNILRSGLFHNILNLRLGDIIKVRGSSPANAPDIRLEGSRTLKLHGLKEGRVRRAVGIALEQAIPVVRIVASFFCQSRHPSSVFTFKFRFNSLHFLLIILQETHLGVGSSVLKLYQQLRVVPSHISGYKVRWCFDGVQGFLVSATVDKTYSVYV